MSAWRSTWLGIRKLHLLPNYI